MVASLLVSVVLLGFKLSALKRLVQVNQRRTELQAALVSLQPRVEAEKLAVWLVDVKHDAKQREDRIAAMDSAAGCVYSKLEAELLKKGAAMFAVFDASSAGAKQLKHSATVMYSETKLDEATHHLFGRAAAMVRAMPQEIAAYILNYDSRHIQSRPGAHVRAEVLQRVHAHCTIIFNRLRAPGVSDRTFLTSIVAKRVADDPPTYMVVCVPIARHDKIAPKDEKGAVRAETWRAFRLTEVISGVTKMEYACSLNLRGSIPQAITNKVSVPGQMHGAPPPFVPALLNSRCLPLGTTMRESTFALITCGWVQCRPRCSDTFSRFGRSKSATPRTAGSSDTCCTIWSAGNRRMWLVRSASLRTAQRCSAVAGLHTSATCSRVCLAPMCKASLTTVSLPFPLHRSQPESQGSTPHR